MITPEELKALPDDFEKRVREIESFAIREIVEATNDPHLAETGITVALLLNLRKLESRIAKLTGRAIRDIDKDMKRALGVSINREIEAAKAAGKPAAVSITTLKTKNGALSEAKRGIENLTGSMGFHDSRGRLQPIGRIYIEKLNECMLLTQSGVMDYREATAKTCRDLARRGLCTVHYATGHVDRMDTAARRAIITGINQASARVTEGLVDDFQAELVETTAHLGARPEHAVWQGQIFSYRGNNPEYPDFVESTEYGDVAGLCGANCRHNFFIFWPGASERAYTDDELANMNPIVSADGRDMTYYDATQMQRAKERAIRKTRRELDAFRAVGFQEETEQLEAKLTDQMWKYRQFSRQVGIRAKTERTINY